MSASFYLQYILHTLFTPGICLSWGFMEEPSTGFCLLPVEMAYELEVLHRLNPLLLKATWASCPAAVDPLPGGELRAHWTSHQ